MKLFAKGSLLSLLLVCALSLQAEEIKYQGLVYQLDLDRATAEVGLNPRALGSITIPEVITTEKGDFRVTTIGDNAFKGAKWLDSITLPPTIERIYRSAFEGTGILLNRDNWSEGTLILDSMYLIATDKTIKPKYVVPEYVRLVAAGAFRGNKTVTKVVWSPRVTRIDHDMFRDCKNLTKVEIPQTVEWIGQDILTGSGIYLNDKKWKKGALYVDGCLIATNKDIRPDFQFKSNVPVRLLACGCFMGNKTLVSLTLPDGLTHIPAGAFYKCENLQEVIIPSSVTRVENFAFHSCGKLRNALLSPGVTELGMGCFYQCGSLQEQVLGTELQEIPRGCFYLCKSLTHLDFPAHLKRIADGAFTGCAELKDVILPESLEEIGELAFSGNLKMTEIVIPQQVLNIRKGCFSGCMALRNVTLPYGSFSIGEEAFKGCVDLERINIPESMFRIGAEAFYGCQSLRDVILPEKLEVLEDAAFQECKRLSEIRVPSRIKHLEEGVFAHCTALYKVELNEGLESIGNGAFYGCIALREIQFPKSLQSIGEESFALCRQLVTPTLNEEIFQGRNAFKGCQKAKQ